MGIKCKFSFSRPPKGTSLLETMSFGMLSVIIGAAALGEPKNYPSEHLIGNLAYVGQNPVIGSKCKFCSHRFRYFRMAVGSNFRFSIDFQRRR